MEPLVGTFVIILLALAGTRLSFSTERIPLGPRLLFRTGTHFLVIGFLIGPSGLGIVTEEATSKLLPFLPLGLGWVGFHFGLQLDRDNLRRFRAPFHAFAIGQAALAFTLFIAVGWMALAILGFTDRSAHLLLFGAASTAAVTAPAGIAMVSSNFLVKGRVRDLLLFVGSVDALLAIVALQAIYSFYRADSVVRDAGVFSQLGSFLAVALGLGILCGIVFLWLVRVRPAGEELVLYLLGICAFAAGAALQWGLSPLFVSMVMGAIVANMTRQKRRISLVLRRWEKPVYVTFLLVAGALLQVPSWWIFPCALAYALLRFASKTVAAAIMASLIPFDFHVPRRIGLGLIPQGGISIAMAVSGVLMYSDLQFRGLEAEAMLFAVVVIGVTLSEFTGPFLTVRVLRHAGEISPQVEQAIAEGDPDEARLAAFRRRSR